MKYLQPDKIVATVTVLRQRIRERFPHSGLGNVCGDLLEIAEAAEQKTHWFGAPVFWLRALCWLISILIIGGSVGTLLLLSDDAQETHPSESVSIQGNLDPPQEIDSDRANLPKAKTGEEASESKDSPRSIGLTELVQVVEACINDIVLIGAAIFFLMTLETRYKRTRALQSIHELRSIAHIIDMHQLTKDPERITNKHYSTTDASPKTNMTKFELRRYLDYCSEMLSLTGKIAAVYVQEFSDSVALSSVNEVETLCTGLSRKIWQKVTILQDDEELTNSNDKQDEVPPTGQDPTN